MEQSIALAVLLHIWLVLVLGSAPAGTAKPGEGVWGRVGGVIDVRLGGLLGDPAKLAEPLEPEPPLSRTGPVGRAKQERFGGAVRAPTPVETEAPSPGAVRLGRWNSQAGEAQATTPPNRITALPAEAMRPLPEAANLALQPMPIRPPSPPSPAPVIEATPVPAPTPTPAPSPAPAPATAPAPVTEAATAAEAPVPRAEPMPTTAPTPTPSAPQPVAVQPSPQPTPQPTPVTTATPTATSPGSTTSAPSPYPAPAGSPDAGSRVGRDVATPASTPPTAAREPLNLSLPRGAATSRQGASGLLSMMPIPPDRKTKLEQEMEAAAKADCRKAYAGAGLLAAVPLVLDAARDKGCRW